VVSRSIIADNGQRVKAVTTGAIIPAHGQAVCALGADVQAFTTTAEVSGDAAFARATGVVHTPVLLHGSSSSFA
jgi:hypothetical protein